MNKEAFITFLAQSEALRFGEFTLKSGRISPYFITTGSFCRGYDIALLGEFYAHALRQHWQRVDAVYGPAYKGIPLCVSTTMALHKCGINAGYVFNRKQKKNYAMKDTLIGMPIDKNSHIVLVDDVITSGAAVRESLECLRISAGAEVQGILVSVDRMEKGKGKQSAILELQEELEIPVFAIVTLDDVVGYLHNREIDGRVYINDEIKQRIDVYREQDRKGR